MATLVGRGTVDAAAVLGDHSASSIALLTQPSVVEQAETLADGLRRRGRSVHIRVMPDGEAAKSLDAIGPTWEWLLEVGVGRSDLVVGVGGGALTDAAGFVAATLARGVDVVLVPTTVLGAVDAAIGGKTAINVRGKNTVGAFWQPLRTIVDLDVLETQPREGRREGLAEALKAGFIADPTIVDLIAAEGDDVELEPVVRRAIAVKEAVVADDPTEAGKRAILNYGHTLGHAIETVTGKSHGESVAWGMRAAAAASELLLAFPDRQRHDHVISRLGFPHVPLECDRSAVLEQMRLDKKRVGATQRMVLLERIGGPQIVDVDDATLGAALDAIGL